MSSSSKNEKQRFKSIEEFNIIERLGSGGYSVVYLVQNKKSGRKYALKCADRFKKGKDRSERTYTEIKVLEKLKHKNIIRLKGWFEDKGVDVEEMFGGEIEVEDEVDVDVEGGEEGDELDLDVDTDGDGDMDTEMDLDLGGGEGEGDELDLDLGGEEEMEESITGMEKHEDELNNLIKGAKQVVINYK